MAAVLVMALGAVSEMVLGTVSEMVLGTVLEVVSEMVLGAVSEMVLETVLAMALVRCMHTPYDTAYLTRRTLAMPFRSCGPRQHPCGRA